MPESQTASPSTEGSSASTLEQEVGEFFGDYTSGSDEPPAEDSTSAAGTTPAEPGTTTATDPDAPAPADSPDPTSEGTTPDASVPALEDDPFANTTPATYVVDGKSVPVEDIRVFAEGGAVIRPESLPNVLSKLAERDTLSERVRVRDQEYQTLAKVAEWTDAASGKTYAGADAAIEMKIGNAALLAENNLLVKEIIQSDNLTDYLITKQLPDGREVVVFSPDALTALRRENALQQREISSAMREHFRGVVAESSKPQAAPIDYAVEAPLLVTAVATAAKLDASVLTPADRALFAKMLPSQVQQGKASIEWQEMVRDRIQDRMQQQSSMRQVATVASDAAKTTQANMAAAARGLKPTAKAPAAPVKTPTAAQTRAQTEEEMYAAQERTAAIQIRSQR